MFFLSLIEHTLPLPPDRHDLPLLEAIKGELEKLFLDKVIKDLGLCVTIYDLQSIEGGFIFPSDGASTYTVVFRLVMFRPFVGEVLVGNIKGSDISGLHVSLGFFEDIHIPPHLLPQPCILDKNDGLWEWNCEGSKYKLYLKEEIRFRVHSVKYPPIPLEQGKDAKPFAPMEIIGDADFNGLGIPSWW